MMFDVISLSDLTIVILIIVLIVLLIVLSHLMENTYKYQLY